MKILQQILHLNLTTNSALTSPWVWAGGQSCSQTSVEVLLADRGRVVCSQTSLGSLTHRRGASLRRPQEEVLLGDREGLFADLRRSLTQRPGRSVRRPQEEVLLGDREGLTCSVSASPYIPFSKGPDGDFLVGAGGGRVIRTLVLGATRL